MAAPLLSLLARAQVPLFGSAELAFKYGLSKAAKVPHYALWGAPLAAGGLWFIWPAVGDESKISWGLMKDPEEAAKEAAAKEVLEKPIELPLSAAKAIETAFVPEEGPSVDPKLLAKIRAGDFGELQQDWEEFHIEALRYNDDDDDDEGKYSFSAHISMFPRPLITLLFCPLKKTNSR
jgi:hypothetical protein